MSRNRRYLWLLGRYRRRKGKMNAFPLNIDLGRTSKSDKDDISISLESVKMWTYQRPYTVCSDCVIIWKIVQSHGISINSSFYLVFVMVFKLKIQETNWLERYAAITARASTHLVSEQIQRRNIWQQYIITSTI
jgi:hypothetical protein